MNALLSVLQPSPAARVVHARLAAVLECSTHHLLNARAEVWEPGEEPEPRVSRGPQIKREPKAPLPPTVDRVFAVLSDRPMTSGQIAMLAKCNGSTTKNALTWLTKNARAVNLARPGQAGQFVRSAPMPDKKQRGPFDV